MSENENLTVGIEAYESEGKYFVALSFKCGPVANSAIIPIPEDPQESVQIADYFYQQLLTAFAEGGKKRIADQKKNKKSGNPAIRNAA